jgi:Uma2 family endonuclease
MKSSAFPDGVRATFASGEVFVEMSPEAAETHNKVKSAITVDLVHIVRSEQLGEAYSDGTLLSHVGASVSTEPDFLFATWDAFESGRLRLIEKTNRPKDYVELEGTPDLVVEIVSDSSETKDVLTLRERYHAAGVPEYWIVDARGDAVQFQILLRTDERYVAANEATGSQTSRVLRRTFRIERTRNRAERWDYRLVTE